MLSLLLFSFLYFPILSVFSMCSLTKSIASLGFLLSYRLPPRRCELAARTQFEIHNSLPVLPIPLIALVLPVAPVPFVLLVAPVPQFTIHNLPIPFPLFRAHYRLKKRLSLWCIKENSKAILLYCID